MTSTCKRFMVLVLLASLVAQSAISADEQPEKLASLLTTHVLKLTGTEKPRSYEYMESLNAAADYIEAELKNAGIKPQTQGYEAFGKKFRNIIGNIEAGRPKTVLLGAHYDVWGAGPGADDNASGVAGLIELARMLNASKDKLKYNVEIIAFTNEEPPFFRTKDMGSYVHAQSIVNRKDTIECMIVLEMIGFYSEKADTNDYPMPLRRDVHPSAGSFIAVVGNNSSADIVANVVRAIRTNATVECRSIIASPETLPGIDFSDHLNYWPLGIKAVMVTDTSFYRNPNYHQRTDKPATLNYSKMAEVVKGLAAAFYGIPKE